MAAGPLHPDNLTNGRDREVTRGHGTRALGPSDSSDSGSDLVGAPSVEGQTDEAALDSDTDRSGTGEISSATSDILAPDGSDIAPDHIEQIPPVDDDEDEGRPARH